MNINVDKTKKNNKTILLDSRQSKFRFIPCDIKANPSNVLNLSFAQHQLDNAVHLEYFPNLGPNGALEKTAFIKKNEKIGAEIIYQANTGEDISAIETNIWNAINKDLPRQVNIIKFNHKTIGELINDDISIDVINNMIKTQIKDLSKVMQLRLLSLMDQFGAQRLYDDLYEMLLMKDLNPVVDSGDVNSIEMDIIINKNGSVQLNVQNHIRDVYPMREAAIGINKQFDYLPLFRSDESIKVERVYTNIEALKAHLSNCKPIISISASYCLSPTGVDNEVSQKLESLQLSIRGRTYLLLSNKIQQSLYNLSFLNALVNATNIRKLLPLLRAQIHTKSEKFITEAIKLLHENIKDNADFDKYINLSDMLSVFYHKLHDDMDFIQLFNRQPGEFTKINCNATELANILEPFIDFYKQKAVELGENIQYQL